MTSIQPELWVETPREAVAFYEAAFGATVLHRVGEGEDVVAPRRRRRRVLGGGNVRGHEAAQPARNRRRDQPNTARGRRPRADRPAGGGRRRKGIVSREQRARLATRPDHRPIRPRVGDRRASWSLAPELSGARRSRPN